MASIHLEFAHQLSREEATQRIKHMIVKLKQEHGDQLTNFRERWSDHHGWFSFEAQGFHIELETVTSTAVVTVTGEAPWFAREQVVHMIGDLATCALRSSSQVSTGVPTTPPTTVRSPLVTSTETSFEEDLLDFFNPVKAVQELWNSLFGD